MNTVLQAVLGDSLSAPARALALAVIYEDFETHQHATALYESILRDLPESAELNGAWWRTSLLTDLQLARMAARTAASADLVIVSVQADREPPLALKFWFDSWPRREIGPAGLVALLSLNGEPGAALAWDAFLQDVAGRRRMLYLPSSLTVRLESSRPVQDWPQREIEPYVHGGLNE